MTTQGGGRRTFAGMRLSRRGLTLLWAVGYGGLALGCLALGEPVFVLAEHRAPMWLDVLPVVVAVAALSAGLRPVAMAGAGVSGFGLLMDAIMLVFDQRVHSVAASINHVLGFAGLVLLAVPRDRVHASRRAARITTYAGVAALLPYVAMKLAWGFGGTFAGLSGAEMLAISRRNGASDLSMAVQESGLDATVLLAVAGAALLVALIRPWGRRVPRVLLLGPALVGAATLAPYGVVGLGYVAAGALGLADFPRGDFPTAADALLVAAIGLVAFAGLGMALAVAARAYWTTRSQG